MTRPDDDPANRRTTNGRPRDVGVAGEPALDGKLVVYRAVDPGTGAGTGRIGELQARGPGVTSGYWDKPEATAAAFTPDGWFRTGDLGIIDEDGYLHLIGRTKDCNRCGGEQVVPKDAEDVLPARPVHRRGRHPADAQRPPPQVPAGPAGRGRAEPVGAGPGMLP